MPNVAANAISPELLDRVVQEVVRRLAGVDSPGNGSRPQKENESEPPSERCLRLSENVISTETLRDRLDGIRRVEIATQAVVTPLVADDLRQRKIELVRVRPANGNADGQLETVPVICHATDVPAQATRRVANSYVQWARYERLQDAIQALNPSGADARRVLVTEEPELAVYRIHGETDLRAAHCGCTGSVGRACDFDCNVLVTQSSPQVLTLIETFLTQT